MVTSVDRLISTAKAEIGYHEGRDPSGNWNNHQKYSPAVPGLEWSQNQAWCATFVSWCAMQAGLADLFPRTASTDTAAAWYKAKKRWSEYPAIGAQGFLGVGNNMHHTFIVTAYDDTYVYTVEGNTNTNGSPQGDGVYALKRVRRDAGLVGYGYPAYPEGIVSADPAWKAAAPKPAPAPAGVHTQVAPGVRLYHNDTPIAAAGGTVGDSAAGTREAARKGFKRADCNGHLMHRTGLGRTLGKQDTDVVWVNAHGAPFNPAWLPKGQKFEDLVWLVTKIRHPRLRSARAAFAQNAKAGIDTEWEVKDLHPLTSDAALEVAFRRLADAAKAAYGAQWQRHVTVKVLTDLSGGLDYALLICRHAHTHGFPTMILARGADVHTVIDEPFITYNRGGRV